MRRKYVKYYEPAGLDANGRRAYRYTGPRYAFAQSGGALKRFKAAQLVISALPIPLFVAAGFVGNEGTRAMYISLPYAASLLPAALMFPSAWALWKLPARFTLPEQRGSAGRLRLCAAALLVLSAMAAIGAAAYMLGAGVSAGECAFLGLMLLSALSALAVLQLGARNPAAIVPGDAPPLNPRGL